MRNRSLLLSLTGAVAIASFAGAAFAAEPSAAQASPSIGVTLNGARAELPKDQTPFLRGNRAMVPMRSLFESFGAAVHYDEATRTITAKRQGTTVTLAVGASRMTVDDRVVALDAPALLSNDRTFVPLRAVGEALGGSVDWIPASNEVRVSGPVERREAPSAAELSESEREIVVSSTPHAIAEAALYRLYDVYEEARTVFAPGLEPVADGMAEEAPSNLWTISGGVRERGDGFAFEFTVVGADANGAYRTLGADIVEVSPTSDGSGYIVTGYGRLRVPAPLPGSPTVWTARGPHARTAPIDLTHAAPPIRLEAGRTLVPIELLKRFGETKAASNGSVSVALPSGHAASFPTVVADGATYVAVSDLQNALHGRRIASTVGETYVYGIVWNDAAKQLVLHVEVYSPIG